MGETLKVKAELLLPAAQAIVTSSLAGQPEEINLREGEAVGELSYTALFWNSLYMVCVGEGADGCFQNLENQIEVWNNCVRGLIHRVQFFFTFLGILAVDSNSFFHKDSTRENRR